MRNHNRDDLLTTEAAGGELGVSRERVRALIHEGRLVAEKHGRDWLIRRDSLDAVRVRKRTGRPKKNPEKNPSGRK